MDHIKHFDTLEDFLGATTAPYEGISGNSEFFDYVDFKKAKELAITGWPDGLKQVEKFRGKMESVISKHIVKQDMIYDVTGLDFDITAVIDGVPECWFDMTPKEEQKTVSILYGVGVSGALSKEQMNLRGAAICSLVDLLEDAGIRVELDIFFDFHYGNGNGEHAGDIVTTIRLKEAGQQLDVDRVAYALMHAGMARALSFSYCQTVFKKYHGHIGWATKLPDFSKYDLVIQRGFSGFSQYANVESMLKFLKDQLKTFGVKMEND